ncbi:MAG: hypothetical protein KJ058_11140 [Thermoanaerobaculia bacterium]|nr:hypothetical protein [Thermoanaerobaculia bacterium]
MTTGNPPDPFAAPDEMVTEGDVSPPETWERKRAWHRAQAQLPLREKFRILLALQRQDYPILAARGALRPWERPWPVEP